MNKSFPYISQQTIALDAQAPKKPNFGEPCNGCGVCCAAEPCPPAQQLLKAPQQGPCPALEWKEAQQQYRCGLLSQPNHYLHKLPRILNPTARRIIRVLIHANQSCDSDAEEIL